MANHDNNRLVIKTYSQEETIKFAEKVGNSMKRGSGLICLYGDLGAGKTTFVKGLAKGLGVLTRIQSPTFTYQRIHRGKKKLYHFDCYRVEKIDTLLLQELAEALSKNDGVVAIEWADKIADYLPKKRIEVYLDVIEDFGRKIRISEFP